MVPRRSFDHLERLGFTDWWFLVDLVHCLVSEPRQASGHVECRPFFGDFGGFLW